MFNELVLKIIPDVYRVRKHKRSWNIYRTENGFVINIGKVYIYYNTGNPFHFKATRITDIRGEEWVEKKYFRNSTRVYHKKYGNYTLPPKRPTGSNKRKLRSVA